MKFIDKFKQKVAFHLFSFLGWITLYLYYQLTKIDGGGIFFVLFIPIFDLILLILFIVLLIEFTIGHKIKNKFILENKFYHIIWLGGEIIAIYLTTIYIWEGICVLLNIK